jgi:hypothetical protein
MLIHKSWLRFVIIVVTGIALFPFLPAPAPVAADGTVTDCSNDSQLSALLPQGGTITFNCSGPATIIVSSTKVITTSVWIDGANGGNPIVLSGGGVRRIFSINSGVTVYLFDMSVTGGRALAGGNVSNAGTLYLTDVTVSNGRATTTPGGAGGAGGGIYNTGSLIIKQSTIAGNTAFANLNSVGGNGGGIYSTGTISITNSTLSGNSADGLGGGIVSSGAASILLNSTVVSNTAVADGANLDATGSVTLKNTILAGGGGFNCSATTTFTSLGHNLSDDTSCASLTAGGDLNNTPASLGALSNNGGQTETHLPQSGSSAINNGTNSGCPFEDQRHVGRPQGGICDIGSVEVVLPAAITVTDCSEHGLDAALFNGGAITFNCGGNEAPATITISAQKVINSDTTIDGGNKVSISGGGTTGIFSVIADTYLGLANLTLSNGTMDYNVSHSCLEGGAINNAGTLSVTNVSFTSNLACNGGAIDNQGTATVTGSSFMNNTANYQYGGAINNSSSMTVTNSQFTDNVSDNPDNFIFNWGWGGGIANGGTLVVIGSTFTGNVAHISGGGIYNRGPGGTLIVSASRILSNTAQNGGGINNDGTLTITASAMAGNIASAAFGGGVDNEANANIDNSTFTDNSAAAFGGGIHNGGPGGTLIVSASRILSNTAPNGGGLNNDGTQIVSTSFFTANMASVGGGINNRGTLSITASAITGNRASVAGGGIFNDASLLVYTSTFVSNNAPNGGGIANRNTLTITGSTLSANLADSGAGIISTGTLAVNASTFNLNSASSNGGGIENAGALTVTNSTISANSAAHFGGGIDSSNGLTVTTTILNSTFVTNTAGFGGGSLNRNGGPIYLKNTIVAYSTLQNCYGLTGNLTTLGHNLDSGTSCNFTADSDLSNTDPKLGPLQNNGGPTLTYALLPGSKAIDAGDNVGCPGTDQRGVARPRDGNGDGVGVCDIGAYEAEANQLFRLLLPLIRR